MSQLNYTPLRRTHLLRTRSNNRGIGFTISVLVVTSLLSFFGTNYALHSMFPIKTNAQQTPIILYPTLPTSSSQLETVVENAMRGSKGKYGILVKNLKTEEIYHSNEHMTFESGSLYKLWIMATAYQQIEEGKLKIDDNLHADIPKLNEQFKIATEDAELKEGEIDFTIGSALRQMITISHNYAALALSQKVGMKNVKAFLQSHDLEESYTGQPPKVSAYDVGVFLEKLYKNKLVSPSSDKEMIALMKEQTINHKLPANLPKNVTMAHKTGEIGLFTHDAGIVYTPKGDYIIVVLSLSDYPPGAQERIATISKAVYDYFSE